MGALGASGAGFTETFGEKAYTFSPWTQLMMDEFSAWLVGRLRTEAMATAEVFRRKARKLMGAARTMEARGKDLAGEIPPAEAAAMQVEWEDMASEAQALQMEAREMVNQISERNAAGYYHFFGLLARESLNQFNGRVKIAHMELLPKHPKIELAEVEKLARDHWVKLGEAIEGAQEEGKKPAALPKDSIPSPAPTTSETTCTESGAGATTTP